MTKPKPRKPRTLKWDSLGSTIETSPYGGVGIFHNCRTKRTACIGVDTPKEARRVADWLNRWADWRESEG